MNKKSQPKLEVLRIIVQPVFLHTDEAGTTELIGTPVIVQADEWPAFSKAAFSEADIALLSARFGE